MHNVEMVQGKANDIKIETDENKKTTLTIVQEFPKKKTNEDNKHIEFEESSDKSKTSKPTTLTIVQDFPKKKADKEAPIATTSLVQE